ncbi:hypothetical protein Ssi03_52400 [Sphaerisporangium siamense]|uniref:Anti-sigma regulatory factor (Ser/Thr protein kinase) n=1 Tax=Sphaerisporangium siamense TaxID=795645 RepID=A0A7W7D847_9ACTN|nr:ATP-binding protein [Sphaerisporangium siamense]MBB4702058.1 anti-sigma regulatory factor (Ser/Thr protein kinase) [Sphaerisporangium siamense]GII87250.1 hypothetical protein Ssi03_52400 [Sphaerisporangium siamense]
MITIPGGVEVATWEVPYNPAEVRAARHKVRATLTSWFLMDVADDVELVVAETLANAISHGAPPIQLALWRSAHELWVRVTDHGGGRPRRLTPGPQAVHGRGLSIVAALATESGVVFLAGRPGKVVWARWALPEVPLPRSAQDPEARVRRGSLS